MKINNIQLIILDRDGVINQNSPAYIKLPEEWIAIDGSLEAIKRLNQAGIKTAVATNQSGIARGYYDLTLLDKIHQKMLAELKKIGGHLDAVVFCPHHPDDHCDCRKPKPGMLLEISRQLKIDLKKAVMIGDSLTDIEAALSVEAQGILINSHYKKFNMPVFKNLWEAVDAVLSA